MKRLILLGGAMGVGKSATAAALLRLLDEAVMLDGDWCWQMDPFRVTERRKEMVVDNITHLLNNFLQDGGYENIILCWVMDHQEIIDGLLGRLDHCGAEVRSFSLVCGPATLRRHLEKDIAAGLRRPEILQRAVDRLPLYEALNTEKLAVDKLTAAEAAAALAARLGAASRGAKQGC